MSIAFPFIDVIVDTKGLQPVAQRAPGVLGAPAGVLGTLADAPIVKGTSPEPGVVSFEGGYTSPNMVIYQYEGDGTLVWTCPWDENGVADTPGVTEFFDVTVQFEDFVSAEKPALV